MSSSAPATPIDYGADPDKHLSHSTRAKPALGQRRKGNATLEGVAGMPWRRMRPVERRFACQ